MASNAKEKLVGFLKQHAFDPVLKAKPSDYPESKRGELEHVQQATRSEIERYEAYGSARELVTNFKRDLHSEAAKKVHRELKALGLPTVNDVRDRFEKLASDLGVTS
jgi:hypothetical protein